MKKLFIISCCLIVFSVYILTGCNNKNKNYINQNSCINISENRNQKNNKYNINDVNWASYFEGINGTAVIYSPDKKIYNIYNQELAYTRKSPCSTFKIISSLIALENGFIKPENSIRKWNGENFGNKNWNKDIDFYNAFRESCIWYFREVTNEIGKDLIKNELEKLKYGNKDISDWDGNLNTNTNDLLNGFWLESSLKISPKEQTEVMERIFNDKTIYSNFTINELKKVMLVKNTVKSNFSIYGKTGMGKRNGIVVDSWFVGFADNKKEKIYYCVYLGESNNKDISSSDAKEIAIKIVSDYFN